jgi:hypothetical protein
MNTHAWILTMTIVMTLASSVRLKADPLDQWHWRNPLPQGHAIRGMTYDNGLFVAVGDRDTILTSPDGTNWTRRSARTGGNMNGVTCLDGLFVAVGDQGIVSSPDGAAWTSRLAPAFVGLKSVAARPGLFVAVGGTGDSTRGTTWSSPDGITWTPHTTPVLTLGDRGLLWSVTCSNGLFVAVGEYDLLPQRGQSIITSADGVTWTVRRDAPYEGAVYGVTFGNGRFIAVGDGGFYSSIDGTSWSLSATLVGGYYAAVTYQGGRFVAVGGQDDAVLLRAAGLIATSTNGVSWSTQAVASSFTLNASAYGNGVSVAAGDYGVTLTSTNAVTWTNSTPWESIRSLAQVASGGGTLVAVGEYGAILSSTNAMQWTRRTSERDFDHSLAGVAYGNGRFVAVGQFGIIRTSTDGVNWTTQFPLPSNTHYKGVAYGNGRFVVVEHFGGIRYSTNGVDWVAGFTTNAPVFANVTYGNGRFVAVGTIPAGASYLGISSTSTDGRFWENRPVSSTGILRDVAFGDGQFVAVGDYYNFDSRASVATSTDGLTWTRRLPGLFGDLVGVAYGGGMWVAVSQLGSPGLNLGGPMVASPDGVTWTVLNGGDYFRLSRLTFHKGAFLAVGTDGAILQSGSLLPALSGRWASSREAFELTVQGGIERRYRLQGTTGLPATNWTDLLTFTNLAPATNFADTNATNLSQRFYRVASP